MKHLLTMLFAAAASMAAQAGVLYWMVDQSRSDDPIDFTYAKIVAIPGSGGENVYLTVGSEGGAALVANEVAADETEQTLVGRSTGVAYTDLSGLSGTDYSFFIELYSMATGQEVMVGKSDIAAYNQLTASIYENGMSTLPSLDRAWAPAINVPEPTSGVLMLFGLAALGLRRKRPSLGC